MIGGYANAWRSPGKDSSDVGPEEYGDNVAEWLALQGECDEEVGTRTFVIGGCCGIFPEHIEKIREVVGATT